MPTMALSEASDKKGPPGAFTQAFPDIISASLP